MNPRAGEGRPLLGSRLGRWKLLTKGVGVRLMAPLSPVVFCLIVFKEDFVPMLAKVNPTPSFWKCLALVLKEPPPFRFKDPKGFTFSN